MEHLFFLGRMYALARAELEAVLSARFPAAQSSVINDTIQLVRGLTEAEATNLQELLGGVIKVVQVTELLPESPTDILERSCAALLSHLAGEKKKLAFGIAEVGRDTLPAIQVREVKAILEESGIGARYVEGNRQGLGASVLLHQNVEECVVVRTETGIYLGYTIAIQNIDAWSVRDRSKPAADRHHGMLPPKIARILINLALPAGATGKRVLDPFCGTGTVVMEALMLGAVGIGSDVRVEAVGQTQKNCEWVRAHHNLESSFFVFVSDATHIGLQHLESPVDAIAAEGFLGKLTPRPGAVPNIYKGLEKLYLGAFKQWTKILAPGSRIAIALPRSQVKNTVYSLAPLVDRLEEYGYNSILPPMIYEREGAQTQREIFVLQFTPVTSNS